MNKKNTFDNLMRLFEKHDPLDVYSLSCGKEDYYQEVKAIMSDLSPDDDSLDVAHKLCRVFNNFLMLSEPKSKFKFEHIDFQELAEDLHRYYNDLEVDYNGEQIENRKIHLVILDIYEMLVKLEKTYEDLKKELLIDEYVDFECLSYREIFFIAEKLSEELNKVKKKRRK